MGGMTTISAPAETAASFRGPHPTAARVHCVELTGPAGRLEALLNEGPADAQYAALICHPHPLGGGTLDNKVVYHAMKAINDPAWGLGWPVLRFNFRGAGLSEGTHHGEAETGDVLAAMDCLENEYRLPIVVVGFSFGAAMAFNACCRADSIGANARALVALGLPIAVEDRIYRYAFLQNCTIPKLILSGDSDQFATPTQLVQVAASAAEPKRLVLLPRADHFFTGQLEPMQDAMASWLREQMQ